VIDVASFRTDFPEFGSVPAYPNAVISYYIALAGLMLSPTRFGGPGSATASSPPTTIYDFATELFVAHHVAIEKQAMNASAGGGVPGITTGPVTSKGVGPVSVSYASGDVISKDAGFWNQTMYGLRFWKMIQIFGAGPIQIGIGCSPYGVGFGAAWPGPLVWPGWQG
jgi:hypothetical protein